MTSSSTIIYTLTDEAPLLATSAFLPIVRTFAAPAGVQVATSDISVAARVLATFADYLKQHKNEIAALDFFYQQPYQRRALTFDMLEDLHDHLSKPPLMLTTERLWSAYARVQAFVAERASARSLV
mgnify:CR=1 FL=1